MKTLVVLALLAAVLLPCGAFAAITYDGINIPTDFNGLLKAAQDNYTGFGDTTGVNTGSELDQLFVTRGANGLYIAVTGNLEMNGNAYVILLDTAPGGSEVLNATNGSGSVKGLNGTTLDPGFAPEYAVALNTSGGTMYVDLVNLVTNTSRYLGSTQVNYYGEAFLGGGDNPNYALGMFNNTNIAGVTDNAAKSVPENEADAATAATGVELMLPFADLGITDPSTFKSVGVMVLLDGGGGWLSNQTLPGMGGGYGNLGQGGSSVSFANIPGNQFATVDVSSETENPITVDGTAIPTDFAGFPVATQNNHTGFGDRSGQEGCELDQLFIGQDANGLQMGITGNMESSGALWLIFFESGPGGNNVLQVPDSVGPHGVLQNMRGTIFDAGFAPTHVLCMNNANGSTWVDLVDLRNGTSRYIGHSPINGGTGDLIEGDNPNGMKLAFNNTNRAGVTDLSGEDSASATTGAEIYMPFKDIALAGCSVKTSVMVVGRSGYMSNQMLPTVGAGMPNLGPDPGGAPVDLENFVPGEQFLALPIEGIDYITVTSVQQVKNLTNATAVILQNVRVSAAFPSDGLFYVQDATSPAGILVCDRTIFPAEGSVVNVKGYVTTVFGQRAISSCETTIVSGPGNVHVKPTGMGNKSLGGLAVGDNPGVDGAVSPSNVGALVKTWGRITGVDPDGKFFYIDDGSMIQDATLKTDGSPYVGIRVLSDKAVTEGNYAVVTGMSSILAVTDGSGNTTHQRLVRTRTASDVVEFP